METREHATRRLLPNGAQNARARLPNFAGQSAPSRQEYVDKCICMARQGCTWCDMTEQWLNVHVEQQWVEEFANFWQMFEEYAESVHVVAFDKEEE